MGIPENPVVENSFYITTLGCPKNVSDSRKMFESMVSEGFIPAENPETSEFHIINSCSFIDSAKEETIHTVFDAASIKKAKLQKIILSGCFAQRYPKEVNAKIPEVDFLFGTGSQKSAGQLIKNRFPRGTALIPKGGLSDYKKIFNLDENINYNNTYSYIKIADGCDRNCNFCIIPEIKGKFYEESQESILGECEQSVKRGASEICLISQDTNRYGGSIEGFRKLISSIHQMDGVKLIRLLYLYPDLMTERILDLYSEFPKIAPYLECPVQHASESVLKKMGRAGNAQKYLQLFEKARKIPELEIRTSVILGFPGETDYDFDELKSFISEVRPEKLAIFRYSEEKNEANRYGLVPEEYVQERYEEIQLLHRDILKEINIHRIGKIFPAISEGKNGTDTIARRYQDAPEADGVVILNGQKIEAGRHGKVRITSFHDYDLVGEWI